MQELLAHPQPPAWFSRVGQETSYIVQGLLFPNRACIHVLASSQNLGPHTVPPELQQAPNGVAIICWAVITLFAHDNGLSSLCPSPHPVPPPQCIILTMVL